MIISSWGRLSRFEHQTYYFSNSSLIEREIFKTKNGLPFGMGRSYGDVCLNPGARLWMMRGLDRFRSFNDKTGKLRCEAGVLLGEIQRQFIPQGWSLAVTPGTEQVTVGGAIANDVHGKNHCFYGSFGNHISKIWLVRTDGTTTLCSKKNHPELFAATIGGLGLTGIITEAEITLRRITSPWLGVETLPFSSLEELEIFAASSIAAWEYRVAWLDCYRKERGIFLRANWTEKEASTKLIKNQRELRFSSSSLPLLTKFSSKLFNCLYFKLNGGRVARVFSPYTRFFYPLDRVNAWNKFYGAQGFFQYQCLIPIEAKTEALREIFSTIKKSNLACFLAVLKWFGTEPNAGVIAFPRPGCTLSLDFANQGQATLRLLSELDSLIKAYQGHLYLAKDARMPRELFHRGYPRLDEFLKYRDSGLSSALSKRLIGD